MALSVVHEAIGRRTPVTVAPHVNSALAAHPLYPVSLRVVEEWGVSVVADAGACEGGRPPDAHWPAVAASMDTMRHSMAAVIRPDVRR